MSIDPKKAIEDLEEIHRLVQERDEIEARNTKLREDRSKLVPQFIDEVVKDPSERETLKRVLAPKSS